MAEEIQEAGNLFDAPAPTKETNPRQRSINVADIFLTRWVPPWSRPPSAPASFWRAWTMNQPVAAACKESLISTLLSLDWKIVARNSQYREELAPVVKYYTKLIDRGGYYLGSDYTILAEWIAGDLLDLPFGGACEVGHKGDSPDGRVQWIRPLDGGTLYPTLNDDFPVIQYYLGWDVIEFPAHAVSRVFMSPRPEIFREGWGIAPPEKIYFALDLLSKGDKYYMNLLLDVPTAGILDLMDMEKDSALEWADSFKNFMTGNESFKVPVLYEHTKDVKFVSLGKVPNDIMYDRITERYATLVCAGYGLSPSDIGIQSSSSSGETLAGSIRQERKSRITGRAKLKIKMQYFWNSFLPPSLMFKYVDMDDEASVAKGRARLATATAFNLHRQIGSFSPQELRSQTIQDGLIDINIPEELPTEAEPVSSGKPQERPALLGSPSPASGGGEGEVKFLLSKSKSADKNLKKLADSVSSRFEPVLRETFLSIGDDEMILMKSLVEDSLFEETDEMGLQFLLSENLKSKPPFKVDFPNSSADLKDRARFVIDPELLDKVDYKKYASRLESQVNSRLVEFLGKSILVILSNVVFDNIDSTDYAYIQQETVSRVFQNLSELVKVHVDAEAENILAEIKDEVEQWEKQ